MLILVGPGKKTSPFHLKRNWAKNQVSVYIMLTPGDLDMIIYLIDRTHIFFSLQKKYSTFVIELLNVLYAHDS